VTAAVRPDLLLTESSLPQNAVTICEASELPTALFIADVPVLPCLVHVNAADSELGEWKYRSLVKHTVRTPPTTWYQVR
jgi:hypothetical protein